MPSATTMQRLSTRLLNQQRLKQSVLAQRALLFVAQWVGVLYLSVAAPVQAETVDKNKRFESGDHRVSLIELYTSEGCSSCPPADRFLTGLNEGEALWENIVPVAFHVSYWDRLGWPDRFAQRAFDTRQRLLAQRANTGVYTPGLFRDGAEFRRWRNAPAQTLDRAFVAASERSPAAGNLKLATEDSKQWRLSYVPPAGIAARDQKAHRGKAQEAFIALLGNDLISEVVRGENAGKKLHHDFVALELISVTLKPNANGELTATFALDTFNTLDTSNTPNTTNTPNAATSLNAEGGSQPDERNRGRTAIAAWVVDDAGFPVQALGGPL